ncbi:MAG: heme peroxidase family protein [Pyrinomonadaceae bacterium]
MSEPYKKISHGVIPTLDRLVQVQAAVRKLNDRVDLPFSFAITSGETRFAYLFPELQTPGALLPEVPEMRARLIRLGDSMIEISAASANSSIPSAYTYLGQFVDHDITFEAKSDGMVKLSDPDFRVLTPEEISANITNGRTPGLDLDNVYYKPAPRNCSRMVLGFVSDGNLNVLRRANDLPRKPRSRRPEDDRAALIGDKRDDENLIIAQLHVAFLRAHNAIAVRGRTFQEARRILRRHYQWIVLKDFLPRICDPWVVSEIVFGGNKVFRPDPDDLFMPFEFSVAAYRFGHSLVRGTYQYNSTFPRAKLTDLFTLTALSGTLGGAPTLPESWIIDWKNFVDGGANRARAIDTSLSRALFDLTEFSKPMPVEARLPVRNLLRGYMLRVPTGQAVASALGLKVLSAEDIEAVARSASTAQLRAVQDGGFSQRTPLWYYILAEASAGSTGRLGPVGSTIVAEVLIGLIRGSKDSILREPAWKPTLGGTPGLFRLRDLLKLGDVLN